MVSLSCNASINHPHRIQSFSIKTWLSSTYTFASTENPRKLSPTYIIQYDVDFPDLSRCQNLGVDTTAAPHILDWYCMWHKSDHLVQQYFTCNPLPHHQSSDYISYLNQLPGLVYNVLSKSLAILSECNDEKTLSLYNKGDAHYICHDLLPVWHTLQNLHHLYSRHEKRSYTRGSLYFPEQKSDCINIQRAFCWAVLDTETELRLPLIPKNKNEKNRSYGLKVSENIASPCVNEGSLTTQPTEGPWMRKMSTLPWLPQYPTRWGVTNRYTNKWYWRNSYTTRPYPGANVRSTPQPTARLMSPRQPPTRLTHMWAPLWNPTHLFETKTTTPSIYTSLKDTTSGPHKFYLRC